MTLSTPTHFSALSSTISRSQVPLNHEIKRKVLQVRILHSFFLQVKVLHSMTLLCRLEAPKTFDCIYVRQLSIKGVLALCEFHQCEFHYCDFSKLSKNVWLMRFQGYLFHYRDFFTWLMRFVTVIIWLMRFYVLFISLLLLICLMRFLANATFSRSQKSHKARTLCTYCFLLSFYVYPLFTPFRRNSRFDWQLNIGTYFHLTSLVFFGGLSHSTFYCSV